MCFGLSMHEGIQESVKGKIQEGVGYYSLTFGAFYSLL